MMRSPTCILELFTFTVPAKEKYQCIRAAVGQGLWVLCSAPYLPSFHLIILEKMGNVSITRIKQHCPVKTHQAHSSHWVKHWVSICEKG